MRDDSTELLDAIISVMQKSDRQFDLTELYEQIRQMPHLDVSRFTTVDGFESRIRKLIYLHASECDLFAGGEDLFFSETGKGTGRWGLRK